MRLVINGGLFPYKRDVAIIQRHPEISTKTSVALQAEDSQVSDKLVEVSFHTRKLATIEIEYLD